MDKKTEQVLKVAWDESPSKISEIRSGFNSWLNRHNAFQHTPSSVIHVRNKEQAVMWLAELSGQISDGWWENSPPMMRNQNWRWYSNAKILIGGYGTTIPSYIPRPGIGAITREPSLVGRIIKTIRLTVNPNYTYAQFASDLKDLKERINTPVRSSVEGSSSSLPGYLNMRM